ncbi:acyl transferase 4-like [Zingiber officinale]|uniref:acyl transferase 4-like n=1 Tax=Zingiber officinale TaxID=94328 RepID=UPI001C4ACA5D|nr:acyl transferase 4-like [Zingiber officinale]
MSMASCRVTKVREELLVPFEPTPCATLPLSSIDHALGLAYMQEMISVYPNNNREPRRRGVILPAAKVIRESLAKALVPYYPVAGRLVFYGDRMEVACNGEGVWFVEAAVTGRSLNDWEAIPRSVVKEELLPSCPPHLNQQEMILMMQVTHFQCGGFVVGLKFNHLVFDGIGVGQFLKAIGEIACGQTHPSIDPIWYRDTIPASPMLSKSSLSLLPAKFDIVNSMYDFSIQTIERLKEKISKETSNQFTTFEVIAAIIWKCRTRAIGAIGDVCLIVPANIRHLLFQLPKAGYYGNCFYPLTITATGEQIMKASLAELVGLVKDAKESLPTKFKEWASGNFKEDPYQTSISYNILVLSDWRWIEFYETDYGWGMPNCISPKTHDCSFPCGVILKQLLPKDGVRLEGQVVMKEHEQRFIDEINKCINE